MASCTLNYIETASGLENDPQKKAELTDIHFNIMSDLLASKSNTGTDLFTVVSLKGNKKGKAIFSTSEKNSKILHHQQIARVNELNNKYFKILTDAGHTGGGSLKTIELIETQLNGPNKPASSIFAVHLLNFMPPGVTDEEIEEAVATISLEIEQEVFENGIIKIPFNPLSNVLEDNPAIYEQLEAIQKATEHYIANVTKNKNANNVLTSVDKRIVQLNYALKENPKETVELVNVLDYVSKANSIISTLDKQIKTQKKRITLLDKNSPEYNKNIANIATFLSEAEQTMRFLAPFTDIVNSMLKESPLPFWAKYNLHTVVSEFKILANNDKTLIATLEANLKNPINNFEELLDIVAVSLEREDRETLREDLKTLLDKAFIKNSKVGAFEVIGNTITSSKKNLKNNFFEFISTVLYNRQLEAHNIEKEEDIATSKNRAFFKSKETIKKELQLADSDISKVNEWLASGDDINDSTANLLFGVLDEYKRMGDLKNSNLSLHYDEDLNKVVSEDSRKALDKQFIHKIKILDFDASLIEADANYKGLTYTRFGKTYKVRETNALIEYKEELDPVTGKLVVESKDKSKYSLDSRIHKATYKARAKAIIDLFADLEPNEIIPQEIMDQVPVEDQLLIENERVIAYSKDFGGYMLKVNHDNLSTIEDKLLWSFDNMYKNIRPTKEVEKITLDAYLKEKFKDSNYDEASEKSKFGVDAILKELNKDVKTEFYKDLFYKGNMYSSNVKVNRLIFSEERQRLFGNVYGGVFLKSPEGLVVFHPIGAAGKYTLPEEYQDYTYYKLSGKFEILTGYDNQQKDSLTALFKNDQKAKEYYKFVTDRYNEANNKYEGNRFNFGELPRIPTHLTTGFWQQALADGKKFLIPTKQWITQYKYKDTNLIKKYGWNEEGESILVDAEGNPTDTPHYIQLNDVHGDVLQEVIPGHTKFLSKDEQQETDLKISMFMFNFAANEYESSSAAATIVPVMKIILKGSPTIGIDARRAKKKAGNGLFLSKSATAAATEVAINSTQSIISAMNNSVYNAEQTDINVGGVSAKAVSKRLKSWMSFTQLALNLKAAVTNLSFGTLSNYTIAAGGRAGLSKAAITKSYGNYTKNGRKFIVDFSKPLSKQSLMSQLAHHYDAQKGEAEDGRALLGNKKITAKSGVNSLLYSTSTLPEHINQLVLMDALYNNFKILKVDGKEYTMSDFVLHEEGQAFTYDYTKLGKLGISKEQFDKKIIKFIQLNTKVNQDAHGQYDKLRKSQIQQHAIWSLGWVYSKWMYAGWKNRYRAERFDNVSGELLEEGYMKTHFKFLIDGVREQNEEWDKLSFLEAFREQFKAAPVKTAGNFLKNTIGKQAAALFDTITFNKISEGNTTFSNWLYGDEDIIGAKKAAIMKANYELSLLVGTIALGLIAKNLAEGLDDEEDEYTIKALKMLELQSARVGADIGFYVNPIEMYNKVRNKVTDPFAPAGMLDNNIGLLKTIFWGDFENGLYFDDVYERSGSGYEKGESKLKVKAFKTVLAPLNQWYTFMDPEQSLKFMDMLNRK